MILVKAAIVFDVTVNFVCSSESISTEVLTMEPCTSHLFLFERTKLRSKEQSEGQQSGGATARMAIRARVDASIQVECNHYKPVRSLGTTSTQVLCMHGDGS